MGTGARPHTLSIGYDEAGEGSWQEGSPGARLLEAARRGATQVAACAYAGISPRSLQAWRAEWKALDPAATDRDGDERLLRFFRMYDNALASVELRLLGSWVEAAESDWRAAQAFLARRYPERWGDPAKRLEISGPNEGPIELRKGGEWLEGVMRDAADRARGER